jgi:hypothetical protein
MKWRIGFLPRKAVRRVTFCPRRHLPGELHYAKLGAYKSAVFGARLLGKEVHAMGNPLVIGKFSFGMGDRFAQQGKAQLRACQLATEQGAQVIPVWNKSNREHNIVGSEPSSTRAEADAAVKALGWKSTYHVDADHIGIATVGRFLQYSDFFTIDVAEQIGKPADSAALAKFLDRHPELSGKLDIPGIDAPLNISRADVEKTASKYLAAAIEAGKIYRHIAEAKGTAGFITEVSMDETDAPQTPPELLVILVALADEKVPLQTIAPKFTGRFNKGVDYVGQVSQFEREFSDDLAVIAYAIKHYGLPGSLKLSVHSGSDKFSIYAAIRKSLQKTGAGVHLKTAGTTWLEEVIGLAEAGGDGLKMAQQIYADALDHIDELCAPYATVIDIDRSKLPTASAVNGWSSEQYVSALQHNQKNPGFNPHLRQLLHVGFKIAAKQGPKYLEALAKHGAFVSKNVTLNLFERHLKPLFLEKAVV